MPITNLTQEIQLNYKVTAAVHFFSRLIGLQHTSQIDSNTAFLIKPCSGVHTFGMKYPIDVVFVDKKGKVVKIHKDLLPNRITGLNASACCVLEFPNGVIGNNDIRLGDHLKILPDEYSKVGLEGLQRILHWPSNIFIALLWSIFVLSAFRNWHQNGELLSLGLVFVNTLLFFLFLTRRESKEISRRLLDWIVPIATVGLSMFLRPNPVVNNNVLTGTSVLIQSVGILGMIFSLCSLGRSFGVIPANRRIKISGAYKLVRHPVYTSEMLFYFGFLIGNISVFNFCAILLILSGQLYRAASEEILLSKEKIYSTYMAIVPYRFFPKIY